jgi:hypothetical protein
MVSDIEERWKQLQILTSGCKLKPGGGVLIARPCHPRDQLPHSRLKNRYYNKQNLCKSLTLQNMYISKSQEAAYHFLQGL